MRQIPKSRFYNINSILGYQWAIFYPILGPAATGKSYSVTEWFIKQHLKYGDKVKLYWLRLSETSTKTLLLNKASKLVDPDLVRKYNLDLTTKGMEVFNHGKLFMTVLPLSQYGKQKGVGYYDKDFIQGGGKIYIAMDEFVLEKNEKATQFDILYNFRGMIERFVRTEKDGIKVFLLANEVSDSTSILKAFDFIPETGGRWVLKRKRCVIDLITPNEAYKEDRKGSLADLLGGGTDALFANAERDKALISKDKVHKITRVIKFSKQKEDWFVVYDGYLIKRYKEGMTFPKSMVTTMRPYLNSDFTVEKKKDVIQLYDIQFFRYDTLSTKAYFEGCLERIRKG